MTAQKSAPEIVEELRGTLDRGGLLPADFEPRFNFRIGWCKNYDDLLALKCQPTTEIEEIIERAVTVRRVLLHARGGGAKTVILSRLIKEHVPDGVLPIWIDLKRWTVADYTTWSDLGTVPAKLDFLFSRLAAPQVSITFLTELSVEIGKLVFVDGLNEIMAPVAIDMLNALHTLVRTVAASAIVVSDRLVRRPLKDSDSWSLATVMPLDEQQIREQIEKRFMSRTLYDEADQQTKALLSVPYFLNSALETGRIVTSAPKMYEEFFLRHVLSTDEIGRTAKAAFDAYSGNKSRSFSLTTFRAAVGDETLEKLRPLLVVNGDTAYFNHHLKHDYLAAVHLANEPSLWNQKFFDHVTFDASSFEVLAMALDMLDNENQADRFVRAIYDWNTYGAAYAVSEGLHRGRPCVSTGMQMILMAVLAERQWDIIMPTAQRTKDALRLFGTEAAQRFLDASSAGEVRDIVAQLPGGNSDFEQWRTLFTRSTGGHASTDDVQLLMADSVTGWTASNVLKRLDLSDHEQEQVRHLVASGPDVVRWRAVHTLGAFPGPANKQILLECLTADNYGWVRYGAIRSLLELAARAEDGKFRKSIIVALVDRADQIVHDEYIARELQSAVLIEPKQAPKEWPQLIIEMLSRIRLKESSDEKWDRWEDVAYKVRGFYESRSQS